jgi:hypothetical protein
MAEANSEIEQLGSKIDALTDAVERIEFVLDQIRVVGEVLISSEKKREVIQAQVPLLQAQNARRMQGSAQRQP